MSSSSLPMCPSASLSLQYEAAVSDVFSLSGFCLAAAHKLDSQMGATLVALQARIDVVQVRAHPAVAHALRVRQALVFSRFTAFFKLYATAPNLGRALMDMCFSRVRFAALETVVDAFKNSKVKVLYAAAVLGFLVKPDAETGVQGQAAVVSEDTSLDVDAHSPQGGLLLPGCAKTIHLGKHPAQVSHAMSSG